MHEVIKTDTGHLCVGNTWFHVSAVMKVVWDTIEAAGSTNIAFDLPPFFYTGCPYGEAILALGISPCEEPPVYNTEYISHNTDPVWRSRLPIWGEVFGVDRLLYQRDFN